MNTCPACDGELPPLRYQGQARKWCSESCRVWAIRHTGAKRQRRRQCEACSADISHLQYKAKVCSKRCSDVTRGVVRPEPLPDRDCTVCGSSFTPWAVTSKYCSKECKDRRPRKAKPWSERRRPTRTCEVCGETYSATHSKQRTCGRECGAILNFRERPVSLKRKHPKWYAPGPASPVWFPDCVQCGRTFTARTKRSRVCGDECRAAREAASKREARIANQRGRRCVCGVEIAATRHKCDDCVRDAKREQRRRRRRRRRARERGAISEPYTLAEIAARDRNVCQLCRKRVAMTKQVPHPKAPTIDHVVPLSDGGDDTKANVQLAHFLCNSLKSAGGSQQLALVG